MPERRWEEPVVLAYDDVPPSMNTNAIRSTRWGFHKHKKQWQATLETLLLVDWLTIEPAAFVWADAVMRFPDRRRRDEGNFRTLLEKALGDALTNAGVLVDDTRAHYQFGQLGFDPVPGPKQTRIRLAWCARSEGT